jgi:tRNA A37 threonylcarbamoyladenosine modification protein TsaB
LAAIGAFVFTDKSVQTVHAVLDARRNHVYHQKISKSGRNYLFSETAVQELEHVSKQLLNGNVLAGTGVHRFKGVSEGVLIKDILQNYDASALVFAKNLFGLCKDVVEVDLEVAEPFYLGAPV